MVRAEITLSDDENASLQSLSKRTGKAQEELLHEAIQSYLEKLQVTNRLALMSQARGIWKDRDDLPDLRALRAEMDRFP